MILTSEAAEHEEEDGIEAAEGERDDVLVDKRRNSEDCKQRNVSVASSAQLVHFAVDVSVEPIVNDDVPGSVVGGVTGRVPPVLIYH